MKNNNGGQDLILLILMGFLACDLVFGNTVMNTAHQILYNVGISQKIEQFEQSYFE